MKSKNQNDGKVAQQLDTSLSLVLLADKLTSQTLDDWIDIERAAEEKLLAEIHITSARMKIAKVHIDSLCIELAETRKLINALEEKRNTASGKTRG